MITDSAGNKWISHFNIILNSPAFKSKKNSINDTKSGNKNNRLDPGEDADIIIQTVNSGHTVAESTICYLATLNKQVLINSKSSYIGRIKPDSVKNAVFNIKVSKDFPAGTPLDLTFIVNSGSYMYIKTITLIVGSASEDFETAGFGKFKWINSDNPWTISDSLPFDGKYCAQSGRINGSGSSEMSISFNVNENDSISFNFRLQTDSTHCFLQFYIDDEYRNEWTGRKNWTKASYYVRPGFHTFAWRVVNNTMVAKKDNLAWLDFIIFPHSTDLFATGITSSQLSALNSQLSFSCFPNPFTDILNLDYYLSEASAVDITFYDYLGREILVINDNAKLSAGKHHKQINTSKLSPGIYFIKINNAKTSSTKTIVKIK
jgi:hypothetical protein